MTTTAPTLTGSDTGDALFKCVKDHPFDEVLRLHIHEWSMENRNWCERAEFVCVQHELEVIGDFDFSKRNAKLGHRCYADTERERLRAREAALLAAVHDGLSNCERWAGIGVCKRCYKGRVPLEGYDGTNHLCTHCVGTGRTGALATFIEVDQVHEESGRTYTATRHARLVQFRRGFPFECEVTMEEVEDVCAWADRLAQTRIMTTDVPLLVRMIREAPTLEMMRVVGVRPDHDPDQRGISKVGNGERTWDWHDTNLPPFLLKALRKLYPEHTTPLEAFVEFTTEQAALDALARAVARVVREGCVDSGARPRTGGSNDS